MAKKKKTPKRTPHHHRRGRIGAAGHFNVMETLETAAGLLIGTTVGAMSQKYLTGVNQKLLSVGQLVIGSMNTNRPNIIVRSAAYGLASAGAMGLAHETGILRGIDEVISGMANMDTLSGHETYMLDGNVNGMDNETMLGNAEMENAPQALYEPMADTVPMGY